VQQLSNVAWMGGLVVQTIVVPLIGPRMDPEGVSATALPLAQLLAERLSSQVTLVSVMDLRTEATDTGESRVVHAADALPNDSRLEVEREHTEQLIADLQQYLEQVATEFPAGRATGILRYGDAGNALLQLIAELDDPLVVMASHARRGVERLVLGSVAFKVVSQAECPVLIVPASDAVAGQARPELHRLLVPLDGSPLSEQILDAILPWLGAPDLELHLVQSIEPLVVRSGRVADDYYAMARADAQRYLEATAERLAGAGYATQWSVRSGDPAREIALAAADSGADMIAMATNGRSGFRRMILGSVAEGVAHTARIPLLLVRPTEIDALE
jgi:nucleotide-binding universal stress UspA family protein